MNWLTLAGSLFLAFVVLPVLFAHGRREKAAERRHRMEVAHAED